MNFYEADIIQKQRLLKELEENPGRRLRCYRIAIKNIIELRKEQMEAMRQGRPFFDTDNYAPALVRTMGFVPHERGQATMPKHGTLQGARSPAGMRERARALGLPVDVACEQTYNYVALADAADMPDEGIVNCTQRACPMKMFQKLFIVYQLGKWPKSDIFCFDKPPENNETSLEYVVDQLRQFIEVAEKKFPGVIKYDEAKLIEFQEETKACKSYYTEIYEMRKHQPSPIAGWDITETTSWEYRDVEYARAKRDEVAERLEKGMYRVPEEKVRVLLNNTYIHFFDQFKFLEERGAAVLFWLQPEGEYYTSPWPVPAYYGGRKLTPLEEEAAFVLSQLRGGTGAYWMDHMVRICRDLRIDAVINFCLLGSTCFVGLRGIIAERAEKELGIPTLQLEGNRWDPSYVDEATLKTKMDEFVQMCLSRKGLA